MGAARAARADPHPGLGPRRLIHFDSTRPSCAQRRATNAAPPSPCCSWSPPLPPPAPPRSPPRQRAHHADTVNINRPSDARLVPISVTITNVAAVCTPSVAQHTRHADPRALSRFRHPARPRFIGGGTPPRRWESKGAPDGQRDGGLVVGVDLTVRQPPIKMIRAAATQMDSHVLVTSRGRRSRLISYDRARRQSVGARRDGGRDQESAWPPPSEGSAASRAWVGEDTPQPYSVVRLVADPA